MSTHRKALGAAAIGLLLVAALAVRYGLQRPAASPTSPPRLTSSYVYSDTTSVQYLAWSETAGGALRGVVYELQDISPGSPSFLTSTLDWTGTRTGRELTISIPGATTLATLVGNMLVRQVMDPHTSELLTERWVRGTLVDYSTLIQAFRDYILLGQDLQGISFELQSAQQNPTNASYISPQVNHYLLDAQRKLDDLQSLLIPHLPGLLTPWVISTEQINATLRAAQQFLSTPNPYPTNLTAS